MHAIIVAAKKLYSQQRLWYYKLFPHWLYIFKCNNTNARGFKHVCIPIGVAYIYVRGWDFICMDVYGRR